MAAGTDVAAATRHAIDVQTLEHSLHLDVESAVNGWLVGSPMLVVLAVLVYRLYYAALLGVLVWTYLWHRDVYLRARRVLVVMMPLALVVFWVFPLAPPRLALSGTVDVIAENDLLRGDSTRDLHNGQNHFSAMPSLHVAWSAWCAFAVWSALRASHPRSGRLAWIFPVVMTAVVLATGNHYVLDVVGSAALLVTAIGVVAASGRAPGIRPPHDQDPGPRSPGERGRGTVRGRCSS